MSDIGFYGLTTILVGTVMLAIAGVGFLIEALILLKRRSKKPTRIVLLGPVFYTLVALSMLFMADESTLLWKRALDDSAAFIAALGLLPWIALHIYQRRRKK
jgi:hypothetical protein